MILASSGEDRVDGMHAATFWHERIAGEKGEGKLLDGKEDGEWTVFYPDGAVHAKVTFKEGKLDGPWTEYWEGGGVKAEALFWSGTGERVEYFRSGKVRKRVCLYSNLHSETLHGGCVSYYANGRVRVRAHYE